MYKTVFAIGLGALSATAAAETKWRGLLPFEPESPLVFGINIDHETQTLSLDSPLQGMFGHVPSDFSLEGEKVEFNDSALNAKFSGTYIEGKLVGTFEQNGVALDVDLNALSEARLADLKKEGIWAGDLALRGDNKLPLELAIALGPYDYHAALNSPAQNSFGIPINEIKITEETLSFESKVISASFSGAISSTESEFSVSGQFVQGFAIPLTLKKKEISQQVEAPPKIDELADFLKSEWGDIPVAVALVKGKDVEFFNQSSTPSELFEIGSITKPLTALLAAKLAEDNQWDLSDIVADLIGHKEAIGHQYSLQQLITHRTGLPRLPENFAPINHTNPYTDFDDTMLLNALAAPLSKEPEFEYSNFGYGLLGWMIGSHYNSTYSTALLNHVFEPLGMNNATVAMHDNTSFKIKKGHTAALTEESNWTFDSLAAAGAVIASIEDMSFLMKAYWSNHQKNPQMQKLLEKSLQPLDKSEPTMAWGWFINEEGDYWHNGQTGGYSSVMAFDPNQEVGVVILSAKFADVTSLGLSLLNELKQPK